MNSVPREILFYLTFIFFLISEFLPRVLGPDLMREFGLNLESEGNFFTGYNDTCSVGTLNEFASAAFRYN